MSSGKPLRVMTTTMIKAILLDLDDTLILNPDRVFAIEYLNLFEQFARETWGKQGVSSAIREAIQRMQVSRDFHQTNYAVKVETISHAVGESVSDTTTALATFYNQFYVRLQACIQPNPIANLLVDYLRSKDFAIIIATNPLYTAYEIKQRLSWGRLNSNFADYAFVTHSENTHYTKPNPAYYAEIIARVGIEPDEVLMVGDSFKNDIEPAKSLGMLTYHITEAFRGKNQGTLENFYQEVSQDDWLDQINPRQLHPTMIEPQMRGNVSALYGLLDGVPDHYWQQHPDPNEWSILQILCHLAESEDIVQRPRLERILNEENPFLAQPAPPPGPNNFPCEGDAWAIAHQFAETRQKTLDWLCNLPEEAWNRPARHSIFGNTNFLEMAHFTAQHDRLHLNQLCQTIGNCT